MYYRILLAAMLITAACSHVEQGHDDHEQDAHEHGSEKFRYTAYSPELEVFAEADPFIIGEKANILSHFSLLPSFKPVTEGEATIYLTVNGKELSQKNNKPLRPGIYSFDLKPEVAGKGTLKYVIVSKQDTLSVIVSDITVYNSDEEADEAVESQEMQTVNTTSFTKEQSWKTDFSTGYAREDKFGKIIKTTALINPSQGSEVVITSGTDGVVKLANIGLTAGSEVKAGQILFTITGSGEDNISVRYAEAHSNYDKAKADYERLAELAKEKIVSEKELNVARNEYNNARAIFDNLQKNFSGSGQTVKSPVNGFISKVSIRNGSHIEAGQEAIVIAQSNTLMVSAEVPLYYASDLKNITTANIKSPLDKKTYSLEELKGKVLSYGKSAGGDNYLVPVNLQIENNGSFIPGSFAELYLICASGGTSLSVPNTALLEEQGNYFLWVQVTPELFEKREVRTGRTNGLNTEVLQGLNTNERIITKGAMLVKLSQATGTLDAHSGHVH